MCYTWLPLLIGLSMWVFFLILCKKHKSDSNSLKGVELDEDNYRPITLLIVWGKIFESHAHQSSPALRKS